MGVVAIVALLLSTAALIGALVSIVQFRRLSASVERFHCLTDDTLESMKESIAVARAQAEAMKDAGLWAGNANDGYKLGEFTVTQMPSRDFGDFFRVLSTRDSSEWVAYHNGQRVKADPDLAEVMRYCESLAAEESE